MTESGPVELKLDKVPNSCPVCKKYIEARYVTGSLNGHDFRPLYAVFQCPVIRCRALFTAVYRIFTSPASTSFPSSLIEVRLLTFETEKTFPERVERVSPDFRKIYNQAYVAETNGMAEIAGPGYRKALEFLVKDYLLNRFKENDPSRDAVFKSMLGSCIERFVDDPRIKAIAKRAAWLGNDETHYYRKWSDKDLQDLKTLVEMTVSWLDLVLASDEYVAEMPE
ncbi:MAG: hypothetical protein QOC81_3682 [Thermoanaerobaculia bacterium]|jgi:hypothetical protein|nr:hypothetical protein [Thermoanaerobaculia bacterium]